MTSRVVSRFAEIGIDAIVMKGPVFRALLYEEGQVRNYGDSDLLVPEADLSAARAAIREMGFTFQPSPPMARKHADRWEKDEDGVRVEVHWTIWGAEAPPGQVFAGLREGVQELELAGTG